MSAEQAQGKQLKVPSIILELLHFFGICDPRDG